MPTKNNANIVRFSMFRKNSQAAGSNAMPGVVSNGFVHLKKNL